jgi:hypothetical protein
MKKQILLIAFLMASVMAGAQDAAARSRQQVTPVSGKATKNSCSVHSWTG